MSPESAHESMKEFLLQLLRSRLSPRKWDWLQEAVTIDVPPIKILSNYTAASRRLGKLALRITPSERAALPKENTWLRLEHWGIDEAARGAILLSVAEAIPGQYTEIALQCYELGDSREQESWLRGLSVLPDGQVFVQTATDSCRTNIIPVFEAIACENPYPSLYFPELNFNQMVLKCFSNRIALSRVVGLESRLNHELSRMADSYAQELAAARREVPKDIHLAQEQFSCRRQALNENV